jgi:FkbM family methyltransferase
MKRSELKRHLPNWARKAYRFTRTRVKQVYRYLLRLLPPRRYKIREGFELVLPPFAWRMEYRAFVDAKLMKNAGFVFKGEGIRELDALIAECSPTMVLYDIGAELGIHSVVAMAKGAAACIAFEPVPECVEQLQVCADLNNLKIETIRSFVTDRTNEQPDQRGLFTGLYTVSGQQVKDLDLLTIDDFCRTHRAPTHMKIDVEGYESEVLAGSRQTLKAIGPVLFLELHCDILRGRGTSGRDVLGFLRGCGYRSFDHYGRTPTDNEIEALDVCRLVCRC